MTRSAIAPGVGASGDSAAPGVERVDILGVGVDALTLPLAVEVVSGWIERREPHYVCITGVHGVMESRRDAGLRRIHHGAGLVTPDGVPLVWLGRRRVTGGQRVERVYGPDLMLEVFDRSQATGWRHFLYGGSPETLALLERTITAAGITALGRGVALPVSTETAEGAEVAAPSAAAAPAASGEEVVEKVAVPAGVASNGVVAGASAETAGAQVGDLPRSGAGGGIQAAARIGALLLALGGLLLLAARRRRAQPLHRQGR